MSLCPEGLTADTAASRYTLGKRILIFDRPDSEGMVRNDRQLDRQRCSLVR